ncbi:divisome protein SepX/GlpR [Nocardioides sp. MAHUQ-72]|uniref:divisome protein SepX/GlpR n=1 Tax=unclassified Nocardioides TaxID=2615069 RepID=UPI0036229D80
MDPSALIFVALAVAWAVYLVPKALKHHDDAVRSRSVDRFSHTMRVLARREPVDRRNARLVVTPGRAASTAVVTTKAHARPEVVHAAEVPAPEATGAPAAAPKARREAANRAARRRRRVLGTVLLANVVVLTLAGFSVLPWWSEAIPAGLLVAWLVACRLMVRSERAAAAPAARRPRAAAPRCTEAATVPDEEAVAERVLADEGDDWTVDTSSMPAAVIDPTLWDPVPVTLPTYVTKPAAARRTVRTIDLDATGVWTSGNTHADSQLAREADEAEKARKSRTHGEDQRAVGS